MVEKLVDYGYTFQVKLLSSLITDVSYTSRMCDLFLPDQLESQALTWIADYTLNYFNEYRSLPTLDAFKIGINRIESEISRIEIINSLETVYTNIGSTDLDLIKKESQNFFKEQKLKDAIYKCIDILPTNNWDKIRDLIDAATKAGESNDISYSYFETLENRYDVANRKYIPTGWGCINEIILGGLGPGELGVVVGPGGSGKSWLLQHISLSAAQAGYNVLYVTLELMETYVAIRHDVILTNIPSMYMSAHLDEVKAKYSELTGKIEIKWYAENTLSINGLRSFIDKSILLGNKPDMVVLDYADLMELGGNERDRTDQRLRVLYQQLRGLAGEYMIPLWTASQSTRDSYAEDVIGADKISESIGKHHTADFMISLTRKDSDKVANTAKIHIVKNRLGRDGMTFVSTMDTNKGIIDVVQPKSTQGSHIVGRMKAADEKMESETKLKLNNIFEQQQYIGTGTT